MKTKDMILTAMLTAVLAVLSIINIPMPSGVPITLQTFAVALCGYVLGSRWGTLSTFLYVLIGTIGVPVFAGMQAGVGILLGPTGGFLFGFIPMAFLAGFGIKSKNKIMPKISKLKSILDVTLLSALSRFSKSFIASL